ncbi:MAG: hypothetical protein IT370_10290, partial [Deltaproteobacteria bacterium]|nr:hypothetical protein [Deltaproteobacteria bacterium]
MRARGLAYGLGLVGLAIGCSKKLESPTPSLTSVTPNLVCGEQLTTPVSVSGDNLTPLPTDTLQSRAVLVLPRVSLTQTSNLDGTAATGTPVVIADDPADASKQHVHWMSEQQLSFDVTPGVLAPGVYDVEVANADEQSARLTHALAVVPPPTITAVVPMSICTAQADSVVEIQGTGFLQVGTALPTVAIRNTSMDVFTTTMPVPSGCSPIAAELGAQIQSCTKLTITIPMGQVQPGSYTLLVTNPAPAACASTQIVPFVVNPPPTISALVPARLCAGGGTITVQGTGFLQGATTTITKS